MKIDIWTEPSGCYLKAPVRSGLYFIELSKDIAIDFLVDLKKTGKKKRSTVYKFVGIRKLNED